MYIEIRFVLVFALVCDSALPTSLTVPRFILKNGYLSFSLQGHLTQVLLS